MLGVIGGVVSGVLIISDASNEYSYGHKGLAYAHIGLGLLSIGTAILLLTATFSALGFFLGLVIGMILLLISILKNNKVQDWLEKARFFGDGGIRPFQSPADQMIALASLGKE